MPINNSPKVKAAREAAQTFGKPGAILLLVSEEGQFEYASWGKDAVTCALMSIIADAALEASENTLAKIGDSLEK